MNAILMMLTLAFVSQADTVQVNETHWRVYDAKGQPTTIEAVVEAAAAADVLYIGETHDDPVVHHLQRELLERVFISQHARGVALSMEMFCRDEQYILDEYLADLIPENQFLAASNPWPNYATDYKPLVDFARVHGVPVVAANAPRRYVNRVTRLGRESLSALSDQARSYLAPLPYAEASDAYRAEWDALMAESMAEMMAARQAADSARVADAAANASADQDSAATQDVDAGGDEEPGATTDVAMGEAEDAAVGAARHGERSGGSMGTEDSEANMETTLEEDEAAPAMPAGPNHGGMGFMLDSQSLWDATMAYSIGSQLMRRPESMVVHVVGAFHVEHHTGIPEHLARYRPGVRQVVVTVRPVEDVSVFDAEKHGGLGDFVILADESLPRTYQR